MRDFHIPGRSQAIATNGMCVTSHPLASLVAVDQLREGANAMDAALAAAFMLGLCEPQATGIGGDCFALIKPAGSEKIVAFNGSGRSPGSMDPVALRKRHGELIDLNSPDAVTIPGAIDGFCRLSNDWGKSGLAKSLAPAIHYAREGIPVSARVAYDWENHGNTLKGAAREFYLSGGKALNEGDVFRHPKQAEVLEQIARHGRRGFYEGEVAQDMVDSLQALGGGHTLDDFAQVAGDYTETISGRYNGTDLVEHGPNGQGATAILMAKILSHFDLGQLDPMGAKRAHLEAEANKLAYDARDRFIADMDHVERLSHMLSEQTALQLAELIDPDRAQMNTRHRTGHVHKDTVCLSVVDRDGMAVSLIYSIYHAFGSGLASSKYGILFQNRGAGFTLEDGHPNVAAPGKRPLHTIIPGMLCRSGRVIMPFGVMGGAYQPSGHFRFLSNQVDFGLSVQAAIDAPRSFSDDGVMNVERGYPESVRAKLMDMGHKVVIPDAPLGGAQAIRIDHDKGVLIGASDQRKDGCAIGY